MAMAEAESNGFEFLSDPVDRFPLMDLSGGNCVPSNEAIEALICAPSDSSMGDAGDRALTMEADLNSTCDDVPLSAPPSEPSTGKDNPQGTWLDREDYCLPQHAHDHIGQQQNKYGHTDDQVRHQIDRCSVHPGGPLAPNELRALRHAVVLHLCAVRQLHVLNSHALSCFLLLWLDLRQRWRCRAKRGQMVGVRFLPPVQIATPS
ncbi:uncharacterized protein [Triticum aestivum]|uniref:uncharacterized protein n=1 Tax=Triticum aestivum TaxID=4565 RepID=UPI001D02796E|nr:uncharacterized protein LOC123039308 [Triticum aestivum]